MPLKFIPVSALLAASLAATPVIALADTAAPQNADQPTGQAELVVADAGQGLQVPAAQVPAEDAAQPANVQAGAADPVVAADGTAVLAPGGADDKAQGLDPVAPADVPQDSATGNASPSVAPVEPAQDGLAPEAARNGIPTVTIFVDESTQAIADARTNDPDHSYGSMDALLKSKDHSVRGVGSVEIVVPEGYLGEYGTSNAPQGKLELEYVRGRGNSTWRNEFASGMASKKPFKIKLAKKQDFFGMGASKEWALLANVYDDTLIRNRMTIWLAEQMGMPYTPQMVPVDLVLVRTKDGRELGRTHMGSYCLSELVDIEEGRLDIGKLKKKPEPDEDVTGGYLLAMYNPDANRDVPENNVIHLGDWKMDLFTKSLDLEDGELTEGQARRRAYISDYIKKLDALIMGDDLLGNTFIDIDRHKAIDEMMDLRSAADYWWIQQFSWNVDAFISSSNYLYKPRGGKLCWGPVWDFDVAWRAGVNDDDKLLGMDKEAPWLRTLLRNDPIFADLLKARWYDPVDGIRVKLQQLTRPGGKLDQLSGEIRTSWHENDTLYPNKENRFRIGSVATFDELIESMRSWIDRRSEWVTRDYDKEIAPEMIVVSYVVDGREVKRQKMHSHRVRLEQPKLPEREGYQFEGWCLRGSDEIFLGTTDPDPKDLFMRYTDEGDIFWRSDADWDWYFYPSMTEDNVLVAKYRRVDNVSDAAKADGSHAAFVSDAEPALAEAGRIAYAARVVLPEVADCDWGDSRMTFTVHPMGIAHIKSRPRVVEMTLDQAKLAKDAKGRTVATFELPVSALEMGNTIESVFSYTAGGDPVSIAMEETLESQLVRVIEKGGDAKRVAYAKALHDFGRTARTFFLESGSKGVTADKYTGMKGCYTDQFDWDVAKEGMKEALRSKGSKREFGGSKVKKMNMSMRFDAESTCVIDIYAEDDVRSFTAHANYKGQHILGKKISDTHYRIQVSGIRADELDEVIEVFGNADGQYGMNVSGLRYAYAVMEKSSLGASGDDLMAAVYNYYKATKAMAC